MKNKYVGPKFCLAFVLALHFQANAFYVHAVGPEYACPGSEVVFNYNDDMAVGTVTWTITNGQIFNIFSQTWESTWTISQTDNPNLNETYPFRVRFDNLPLGTKANVKVDILMVWRVEGNKEVTLGPSPGSPIINGAVTLLNCIGQQQNYTPINLPPNWNLTGWTMTSNLQQVGSSINPITIQGTNTTYSGSQTLTGQFQFSTGGVACGTQNVNKPVWVGKPSASSQVVDGGTYWSGYQICPGNHWVGLTWNGVVTSTSWSVPPGISYYTNNTICNFTLPPSSSAIAITVNATNTCGTSSNASFFLSKKSFGCGAFMITSYPNPATDEITVASRYSNSVSGDEQEVAPSEIALINERSLTVYSVVPTNASTRISLSAAKIPPGSYIVRLRFGNDFIHDRLIVKGK